MKKTKKTVSSILSAAVLVSSMAALPVAVGAAELPSGYSFVDIAHKPGSDIYLAEAKDSGNANPKIYYSNDSGLTWSETTGAPLNGNAVIGANQKTQQQLEWWGSEGVFVLHGNGLPGVYTSSDGVTWTERRNLQWGGNNMLYVSGDKLMFVGEGKTEVASSVSSVLRGDALTNGYSFASGFYTQAAAAATDDNGVISVYAASQYTSYYMTLTPGGDVYTLQSVGDPRYNQFGAAPYDAVYAKGADRFLAIDGEAGNGAILVSSRDRSEQLSITVAEDKKVTGIAANDKYIVAGMNDGSIYYTANTALSDATVWTEIYSDADDSEPIKNIALDGESFVALGSTQIYRGTIGGSFMNVNDYVDISAPVIVGGNMFDGIKLLGGAYNGETYVVYGNTAENHGKVFTSPDALNWKQVYEGNAPLSTLKNGAVWFENEKKFIISASTQATSGASVVGTLDDEEGLTWAWVDEGTGYGLNAELAVGNDNILYSPNNITADNAKVYKYSAWSAESREEVALPGASDYMNHVAVSGDASDPAIFVYGNAAGVLKNSGESGEWTSKSNYAQVSGFTLTDAVYCDALEAFVAVSYNGANELTTVIPKDGGDVRRGPRAGGSNAAKIAHAIDVNNEAFMFACQDGLYTVPVDASYFAGDSTDKLTAVQPASGVKVNTKPVVNVFKAGDGFIAVANDGKDSEVLIVENNGSGYKYNKASGRKVADIGELDGASSFEVRIDGINNRSEDYSFKLITAIFSKDGYFLDVAVNDLTIPAGSSEPLTTEVSLGDAIGQDVVVQMFMWNSFEKMVPIQQATSPF